MPATFDQRRRNTAIEYLRHRITQQVALASSTQAIAVDGAIGSVYEDTCRTQIDGHRNDGPSSAMTAREDNGMPIEPIERQVPRHPHQWPRNGVTVGAYCSASCDLCVNAMS